MTSDSSSHVKLLFEVEAEDGSIEIESVWAVPVRHGYRLDSIPFYAKEVACGDVVDATPDSDGALRFSGLVAPSGHSTVRLWFEKESDVPAVRETLRRLGCASELDLARLVAVDIPPEVPYDTVRAYLDERESEGTFQYEEACLAQT